MSEISNGLETLFPEGLWVKAEINSLSERTNGHCYLGLSQSDATGNIIAQVSATIWRYDYQRLSRKFEAATKSKMAIGMTVMLYCTVKMHQRWGLSLNVTDVDPEFTLGEKEANKRKTIEMLEKEGLLELQKELVIPDLPYKLAVISSETAAGFGDFRKHLIENEYGFVYQVDLFPASMQGDTAPASISSALFEIASARPKYDVVLIMRGGGSELDLACFDDYELAKNIANFDIPVITAIGHEKDYHVADMVANTFVKTPTALADLILNKTIDQDAKISGYMDRLMRAFQNRITNMMSRVDNTGMRIARSAEYRISSAESNLKSLPYRILRAASNKVGQKESALTVMSTRVLRMVESRIMKGESQINALEIKIAASDPRVVLKKGYSLILNEKGVRMASAKGHKAGDKLSVVMPDGRLICDVNEVKLGNEFPETT